jgi:hypothetical protein
LPPKKPTITGPDGYMRPADEEKRLNLLAVAVLGSAAGRELLHYLRSITIERVAGPEITDGQLRHLEGSRYLLAIMEQRINLGHKAKANEGSSQSDGS